jgi:ADP-ribose pyrophosphatase
VNREGDGVETLKLIRSQPVFQGRLLQVRENTLETAAGKRIIREFVGHAEVVAIIALLRERVILERQYRPSVGEVLWEIPAGGVEPGETPLQAAQRELKEETGYRAASWEYLLSFYTSPGFTDEIIHLFRAAELEDGHSEPDEDEVIERHDLSAEEIDHLIKKGAIKDGKTILALQHWFLSR